MSTMPTYEDGLRDGKQLADECRLWLGIVIGLVLATAIVVVALFSGGHA